MAKIEEEQKNQETKREEQAGIIFHGEANITQSQVAGNTISGNLTVEGSAPDLSEVFAPLYAAARQAPPLDQETALKKVEELEKEVAKEKGANDDLVASLLEGLVELVPGAISAVGTLLGQPILAGLAGPATQYVLKKITGKKGL